MDKYNTFGPRFWAGMIDGLVFMPIGLIDDVMTPQSHGAFAFVAWSIVSYSSVWLYSVFLHARYGQTLGKMVTKIKVLDLSEDRVPSLRQALIRDIGYVALNTLTLVYVIYLIANGQYTQGAEVTALPGKILAWVGFGWFLLEITTMLTNEKRRAFHDYIAGTVVTRNA
jgi:uncharacterized RDD family membrane protein YckC